MRLLKRACETIKNSRLAKTASIYTISTFLNSATPFILLPISTRYLSTEEYGILSMFNATTSFLIPFVGMSTGTAILRKVADGPENEGKEYVYNCIIIVLICTIIVSLVTFLESAEICSVTEIPISYLPLLIVFTTSTCICNSTLSLFQIRGNIKGYAFYQNLGTLLNLVLSTALVVGFKMSLTGRIYGLSYSKLLFAGIGIIYIYRFIGNNRVMQKKYIKDEILNFGIPMIPTEIKATILTYTDRFFITNMVCIDDTGIYSVGNQFSMPLLLLEQAFNLAYVPWLFKKLNENRLEEKKKIVKLTYIYFGLILALSICWSVLSKSILTFIAGKDYSNATAYIFWLSLGYAFTGMHMMVVNYIYYIKKVRLYSIVTIAVIFTNVILNYIFINEMGAVGAAIATCIANVVSFILTWILSAHVYKMPWRYICNEQDGGE